MKKFFTLLVLAACCAAMTWGCSDDKYSAASLRELAEIVPKFMDTRPVREGRVYNNNRRTNPSGGNDYWESGVIHPDLILQDLIRIFHPELTDAEPTYYRKLN